MLVKLVVSLLEQNEKTIAFWNTVRYYDYIMKSIFEVFFFFENNTKVINKKKILGKKPTSPHCLVLGTPSCMARCSLAPG